MTEVIAPSEYTQGWNKGFIEGKQKALAFYDLAINDALTKLHSLEALTILRDAVGIETPFDAQAILDQLGALIREIHTQPNRHAFVTASAETPLCQKCGEAQDQAPKECAC